MKWGVALPFAFALLAGSAVARADLEPVLQQATASLEAGKEDEAIAALEGLADRGEIHPDVSFTRGIAYARRAAGAAARPGDLGRAAAGLEEALGLRPTDGEAALALETVRGEIARRRSRRGKDEVSVGPPPDRLLAELASERTWAALAAAASLVLTAGLVLRRRPAGPARVAGVLGVPLGLLGLLLFAPATWWSGVLTRERGTGVVVVPELTLTDEAGARVDAPIVPEGSRLETAQLADGRLRVRWGSYEGWAPLASVRRLAR